MNRTQGEQPGRAAQIVRTSALVIGANIALAGTKAAVGLLSNSIAIVMDAVNNLSDALSSVITILGTRLSAKPADHKHPYGHGRIEYLTAAIISLLVLYAGGAALVESVKKIITPETPDYSPVSIALIAAAVAVKLLLGRHVKKRGRELRSEALVDSGEDARLDAVISASTLAAAVIYLIWGLSLEAWLGAAIALIIVWSGVKMLRGTLSEVLGERVGGEISTAIKQTIGEHGEVLGAYDLIIHDYGPELKLGSVHIEVRDTMTAAEIDALTRAIQEEVLTRHQVILTAVGIYAQNTSQDEAALIRDDVRHIVMGHEWLLQLHGFYLNREERTMRFDIIVDFAAPDRRTVYLHILQEIQEKYPDYRVCITLDEDVSD